MDIKQLQTLIALVKRELLELDPHNQKIDPIVLTLRGIEQELVKQHNCQ